jgi:hypothetical protein
VPTPATQCFTPFQAQVVRATRLDACGAPVHAAKSTIVSDGIIDVQAKRQEDKGDDVIVKKAKGTFSVNESGKPQLKWYDVTLTMTQVDPDLFEMATGQQLVLDKDSNPVGFRVSESIPTDTGIAWETWTKIATDNGNCGGGSVQYGYFLLPRLTQLVLGDFKVDKGAMDCIITGNTKHNSAWGVGPHACLSDQLSDNRRHPQGTSD